MFFAIDLNRRLEKKYPRLFDELQAIEGTEYRVLHLYERGIPSEDQNAILALTAWRKNKVIFHFDGEAAKEITTMTEPPEKTLPLSELKHLPYSSFALKTDVELALLDHRNDKVVESFTGNAFVWLDREMLNTVWEKSTGEYFSACIDLSQSHTINDLFDDSVVLYLSTAGCSAEDIALLKRLCGVANFHELTEVTQRHYTRMRIRLGEKMPVLFNNAIDTANLEEALMSRLINIIMYLGCENADIENAAEKLKAGAMAGVLMDKALSHGKAEKEQQNEPADPHVSKTEARSVIREIGDSTVLDVGYRIAAKWRRQAKADGDRQTKGKGTGGKRGYGTRRGHWHHFWIGPRDGNIAEDIMNPLAGEKGLRRRWLDDTEIHPELKNDQATVIPVE